MAILWAGSETDEMLLVAGTVTDITTAGYRRAGYCRAAVRITGNSINYGGVRTPPLDAGVGTLWACGLAYLETSAINSTATTAFMSLMKGVNRKLVIRPAGAPLLNGISLFSRNNAGTETLLATSDAIAISDGVLTQVCMQATYAASGRVRVFVAGVPVIDYSGDVTTDGDTTLDGAHFGQPKSSSGAFTTWSEMILSTTDPRSFGVRAVTIAGAGNTNTMTGTYADVDEVTANDGDMQTAAVAGLVSQYTVAAAGITTTEEVRALVIVPRAMKGVSGPTTLDVGVRTGGADYYPVNKALDTAFGPAPVVLLTNPATAAKWTQPAIVAAGFNLGVRAAA